MTSLVSPLASPEERDAEASVRPKRLSEFVAQERVREQLEVLLHSAIEAWLAARSHPLLRLARTR